MRYLVGLMSIFAMVALCQSVSAQTSEEGVAAEPSLLEEPAPSSEPAPEEPALQLKLDAAGVEVTPSPSLTEDGYTLEEKELRVKRAKMGLLGPAALIVAGVPLLMRGRTTTCPYEAYYPYERFSERCERLRISGIALMAIGGVGMIVGSSVVGVRKRELRWTVNGYTLEEKQKRRSKRRKIALGVTMPILGAVVGLAIGGAVAMSNSF